MLRASAPDTRHLVSPEGPQWVPTQMPAVSSTSPLSPQAVCWGQVLLQRWAQPALLPVNQVRNFHSGLGILITEIMDTFVTKDVKAFFII